ncbi:Aldo/keto reductase [Auriscalpium vulgare]|uniref:Aldo/keto reductase n=1 Tax=Auriscalpium vulgare TaxID=40419 RepID=A0ACB8RMW6_9AGAM|nr:Aldo/keto reductase [Auriscalpium vulgare]
MSYGTPDWQKWALSEEEGIAHINLAYENDIQTFDTADLYLNGLSEVVLGKAINRLNLPREEIVIMTKVCTQFSYHCRTPRITRPRGDRRNALHDVVKAGYVRYIGMSSCWAWQFHAMQNYAITHNLTLFISMQNYYNLLYREEEREMPTLNVRFFSITAILRSCKFCMLRLQHFGIGALAWSPVARGALTRPVGGGADSVRTGNDRSVNNYTKEPGNQVVVQHVEELAKKYNKSMAQIGLAWMLSKDVVSAPIVGTTSLEKLTVLSGRWTLS